jgi:hypothetical protein
MSGLSPTPVVLMPGPEGQSLAMSGPSNTDREARRITARAPTSRPRARSPPREAPSLPLGVAMLRNVPRGGRLLCYTPIIGRAHDAHQFRWVVDVDSLCGLGRSRALGRLDHSRRLVTGRHGGGIGNEKPPVRGWECGTGGKGSAIGSLPSRAQAQELPDDDRYALSGAGAVVPSASGDARPGATVHGRC